MTKKQWFNNFFLETVKARAWECQIKEGVGVHKCTDHNAAGEDEFHKQWKCT